MDDSLNFTHLDLRFLEIEIELDVLHEYMKLVERNMPAIVEEGKRHVRQSYDFGDLAERFEASDIEEGLEGGVITRFFTAALVVACWATYESAVRVATEEFARPRDIRLKLSELRGGFLEQATKYYRDVLQQTLHSKKDLAELKKLSELRNALAHTNGQLENVPEQARERLRVLVDSHLGLDLWNDCIIVSVDYAQSALRLVDRVVRDLIQRVKTRVDGNAGFG